MRRHTLIGISLGLALGACGEPTPFDICMDYADAIGEWECFSTGGARKKSILVKCVTVEVASEERLEECERDLESAPCELLPPSCDDVLGP